MQGRARSNGQNQNDFLISEVLYKKRHLSQCLRNGPKVHRQAAVRRILRSKATSRILPFRIPPGSMREGNTMENLRRPPPLLDHCCVTAARWRRAVYISATLGREIYAFNEVPRHRQRGAKALERDLEPVFRESWESAVAVVPSSGSPQRGLGSSNVTS